MGPSYSFLQFGLVALAARLDFLWNFPKSAQATAAFRPSTDPPGVSPSSGCWTAASFGRCGKSPPFCLPCLCGKSSCPGAATIVQSTTHGLGLPPFFFKNKSKSRLISQFCTKPVELVVNDDLAHGLIEN
jgi:hypothetical protein